MLLAFYQLNNESRDAECWLFEKGGNEMNGKWRELEARAASRISPDMAASRAQVVTIITRSLAWTKLLSILAVVAVVRSAFVAYVGGQSIESSSVLIVLSIMMASIATIIEFGWAACCLFEKKVRPWYGACEIEGLWRLFGQSGKRRNWGLELLRKCGMLAAIVMAVEIALVIPLNTEALRAILISCFGTLVGCCILAGTFLCCEDIGHRRAMRIELIRVETTNNERGDDSVV